MTDVARQQARKAMRLRRTSMWGYRSKLWVVPSAQPGRIPEASLASASVRLVWRPVECRLSGRLRLALVGTRYRLGLRQNGHHRAFAVPSVGKSLGPAVVDHAIKPDEGAFRGLFAT